MFARLLLRVVSSEEERFLDTEEVTGSIPVPPTDPTAAIAAIKDLILHGFCPEEKDKP